MTELEGGIYHMNELRYRKYLVREETEPEGFLLDEMEAKAIITLVLVVFIVGAAIWINTRNRKNKQRGRLKSRPFPFSEARNITLENHSEYGQSCTRKRQGSQAQAYREYARELPGDLRDHHLAGVVFRV